MKNTFRDWNLTDVKAAGYLIPEPTLFSALGKEFLNVYLIYIYIYREREKCNNIQLFFFLFLEELWLEMLLVNVHKKIIGEN